MRLLFTPVRKRPPHSARRGIAFLLVAVFLLAGVFLLVALPGALARETAPAEMIADELPRRKTLKSATKSELIGAICAAVRKHRSAAALIAPVAIAARPAFAGEIVGSILRCSGKLDCEFVGAVVAAAASVEGVEMGAISDAAVAKASDCAETIREASRRKPKPNGEKAEATASEPGALIGTSAGPDEGFDPHEKLEPVCDNGTQRAIRASELNKFLGTHPGAVIGSCQTPPQTNP